jgi:outer membrane protein assembly factor BamB
MKALAGLIVAAVTSACGFAAEWPGWRGPTGDGVSTETSIPLKWSRTDSVRWKTPLPDEGNSSPVVWKDRVFITQATEKTDWPPKGAGNAGPAVARRRSLRCYSRADGQLLWQKDVIYDQKESTHLTNPFCSASPVTDGERVVVSHGSAGLFCYDFAGKEQWRKDVGKLEHIWGNASSPVLYGGLVILWAGPGERQVLLAADMTTGKTVWEHSEPGGNSGKEKGSWLGSWSTPLVVHLPGRDELIVPVPHKLKAFDPKTGKELWSCDGMGPLAYASPVVSSDGIVVAMSGFHGPDLAVRAGGNGDVTKTRLWRHAEKIPQRIGSPIIVGKHAYLLSENGLAQCFDLQTGEDRWNKQRVSGSSWGSMAAAGERLYVTNLLGETMVLAAKPEFEVLARNRLDERTLASPAISVGDIFIRTYKHLWCIGEKR